MFGKHEAWAELEPSNFFFITEMPYVLSLIKNILM